MGEGIGRPAGPDNRDFPGLLGAEVERDFQVGLGGRGWSHLRGGFREGTLRDGNLKSEDGALV